MRPDARLKLSAVVIVMSAIYSVLVVKWPHFASALMLGYVGILLTIILLSEVWKKNE